MKVIIVDLDQDGFGDIVTTNHDHLGGFNQRSTISVLINAS
jgi:hypothetical protein